jgi:hypothetical protein
MPAEGHIVLADGLLQQGEANRGNLLEAIWLVQLVSQLQLARGACL